MLHRYWILILIQLVSVQAAAGWLFYADETDRQLFFTKTYCLSQKIEEHPQVKENKKIFETIQNNLDTTDFLADQDHLQAFSKCKKSTDTQYASMQADKDNICPESREETEADIKYRTFVAYYEALEKLKSTGLKIISPLPKPYKAAKPSLAASLLGFGKEKSASEFKRPDLYAASQYASIQFMYQGKKYSLSPRIDTTYLSLVGTPAQEASFEQLLKKSTDSDKKRQKALAKEKSIPISSLGETYDVENKDFRLAWTYDEQTKKYRYNDSHFGSAFGYMNLDELPQDGYHNDGKTWNSCYPKTPSGIKEERAMLAEEWAHMNKDTSFCNSKNERELKSQLKKWAKSKTTPALIRCQEESIKYLSSDRNPSAAPASPLRNSPARGKADR